MSSFDDEYLSPVLDDVVSLSLSFYPVLVLSAFYE